MSAGISTLTKENVSTFTVSKVFKPEQQKNSRITGLDFSRCGQHIVTSSSDDTIKLYSSLNGELTQTYNVRKFGAGCVKFTHHGKAVLESGFRNQDCCIRYHSLHDNSYIRCFAGHQLPINNLVISPVSDTFLTSSSDKTVRLWDMRQETAVALIRTSQNPVVAFDNEGLIFGVGASRTSLKLFDIRNYGGGAFVSWLFDFDAAQSEWVSMEFSPDSKWMLINSNQNFLMVLDAFSGKVSQTYHSHENTSCVNLHGTFSPDSQFVCCGSTNGDVHIWDRETTDEVCVWHGHPEPVTFVRWNPMRAVCATAGSNLAFWLPRQQRSILKQKSQALA